ncbi:hypothetical protein ABID82_004430 [Methylobacterium sp. PvP062]|uniref:DUF3306 domain-containing protein n=1 Tax=Methylobacterium radiotolerans TaxID=31998 RepID=A0ABV2NKR1_9HYPH|nr:MULTISPECIES: DUF3306 domain-containing protein [unclassified Methylobacterium]MBP2496178.1 hypothetical protein [Methylobacterium sp. PvP105]MBP2503950.1 hypothetical protein [Methylobacterium sp. PvP109]MCX7336040.1 DUF3306 domain-containing protein [Hyphomicrobiales bacterium]
MSENFLSRWTRRKRAVRAAALAERAAPAVSARAPLPEPDAEGAEADLIAPQTGPEARPPEPEPADDPVLDLPSLEALTAETDLAPFLRACVPVALRNAALRRMWSLDPAIRDFVSEAREYAYDWNSPGGVPGLGPLLPSDEVQAMLGRLLGGAAKATPVPGETRDSEPDGSPEPGQTPECPPAADRGTPGPDPQEQAPALSAPAATVQQAAPASPDPERGRDAVPAAEQQEPSPGPRLRRHGGAMPNSS